MNVNEMINGLPPLASTKVEGVSKHTLSIKCDPALWAKFQEVKKVIRESKGKRMTNDEIGKYFITEMHVALVPPKVTK